MVDDEEGKEGEEGEEEEEDTSTKVTGSARLAWLFVEGWRQRLRMAGDLIEKKRWEWYMASTPSTSVLSLPTVSAASTSAVRNASSKKEPQEQTENKSARWSL